MILKTTFILDWSQSLMSFFSSKTDIFSQVAIYKLLIRWFWAWSSSGLGLNLTIRKDRILR